MVASFIITLLDPVYDKMMTPKYSYSNYLVEVGLLLSVSLSFGFIQLAIFVCCSRCSVWLFDVTYDVQGCCKMKGWFLVLALSSFRYLPQFHNRELECCRVDQTTNSELFDQETEGEIGSP